MTDKNEAILLSISLLVSNRKDTIRKCMESIKPLLDKVPSELIAVDTVGAEHSDGSLAIVKEYTDHVIHFDWCNDFAAARNAGLEIARGEWFLFLDDDEWFEDAGEIVEFFRSGEYKKYNSATYRIRNYKDYDGKEYGEAILSRMVRLQEGVRFVGRIHEVFSEFRLPCKDFSAYVHHYGYVYASAEERQKHIKRNVELLRQELQRDPKNLHFRTQMALELATFDNVSALKFCEETLQLCKEEKNTPKFQWILSLIFRLYEALGVECAAAEERCWTLKVRYGFNETAEHAISYLMTRICLIKGEYAKAFPYAKRFFELDTFLKQNTETAQLQMAADFIRYRAREVYLEMLHFGAFSAWQTREYETAWQWYALMPWEEEGYENEDGLWKLFAMAEEYPNSTLLLEIIQRCKKNKKMEAVLETLMQKPEVRRRVSITLTNTSDTGEQQGREVLLTISLLVSNRIDTIRKCMESLKPLLDAIPSELVAVDTVGEEQSDGSIAVVKEYTDKIVRFEWCNDFSAARNAGLKEARGKWFLYLDDDEWFEDVSEIADFFRSGEYKNYDRGFYYVRNYSDLDGKEYLDTPVDRMSVVTQDTRFENKIHEYLYPHPSNVKQFSCYAHHYGYAYKNEEAKKKHFERNITLMLEGLEKNPKDARMMTQLIQEYASVGKYKEAAELCNKWLKEHWEKQNPFMEYLVVLLLRIMVSDEETEPVPEKYEKVLQTYPLSDTTQIAALVEGTKLDIRCRAYAEGLKKVKKYFELKLEIENRWEKLLAHMVLDIKNYVSEKTEEQMLDWGMQMAVVLGEQGDLTYLLEQVNWTDKQKRPFGRMMQLIELYGKTGVTENFFPYAELILKNPGMKKQFMLALEELCRTHPERKEAVQTWIQEIQRNTAPKPVVSAEMRELVLQLKKNVEVLLAAGRVEEARALMSEMKQLLGQ